MKNRLQKFFAPLGTNRDLLLVVWFVGILVTILMPLPPAVMDFLLVVNISLSVLILLTSIYVRESLDFSIFPSLLLMTTLYRLALNIATTRMILGGAKESGKDAAGSVVRFFGEFVSGSDMIVGFVIFIVLVIVQFVVITKGATRVAEVAARFTLDRLPGQQMAIDGEIANGLIDEKTATEKRQRLMREADFYGAMDGASKFVRGDAVAGILITLINIIGGLVIGMTVIGWDLSQSLSTFTLLTIGDGLVSQIPAVIISTAAGLIVTRTSQPTDLGSEVTGQLFSSPKAIGITAVVLLALIPVGLPPLVLITLAISFALISWLIQKPPEEPPIDEEAPMESRPARSEEIEPVVVEPLELEIGYALVTIVDPADGEGILPRIGKIRAQLSKELGIVVPRVRVRDNITELSPREYRVKLRGEPISRFQVETSSYLVLDSGEGFDSLEGNKTREPAFGVDALWVGPEGRAEARRLGLTVSDPATVIATHLTQLVREHCADFLTREEVNHLIERTRAIAPRVVEELVPAVMKPGEIQKVLQNLLREGVPVRDLETIFEILADRAPRTGNPEVLTEWVREGLSRTICGQHADSSSTLHVVTLDGEVEEFIENAVEQLDGGSFLRLSPQMKEPIIGTVSRSLEVLISDGHPPLVLSSPKVRAHLRRLMEKSVPAIVVLSYNEVAHGFTVESSGVVRVE
ncbi:MAG TPA: flagellar biosynthesis protein FlhA [Planctomycetes bacterium]|nr:flagellar biosynthesis protein FlhA [Planctomycetota bacterium]HIN79448.1 flagellar biosynthesis protein FlhA [Planctomycetota bacterium]